MTLALQSENADAGGKDYFVQNFTIDWSGTKTIRFPAEAFKLLGTPVGFQQIDGILLFTNGNHYAPTFAGRHPHSTNLPISGVVEIMYPGGRPDSGFQRDGWNWNRPNGGTTIILP